MVIIDPASLRLAAVVESSDDAIISHKNGTRLNAVVGYTRMPRMGHFAGERRDHAMEVIERNANILSQLVSDLLDVSSIVTGKIQLKTAPCDLGLIIAAATESVPRRTPRASRCTSTRRENRSAAATTPTACSRCSGTCSATR